MSPQNPGADTGSQPLNESPAQRGAFFFADFIRSDQRLMKRSRLGTTALATFSTLYFHRLAKAQEDWGINARSWQILLQSRKLRRSDLSGENSKREEINDPYRAIAHRAGSARGRGRELPKGDAEASNAPRIKNRPRANVSRWALFSRDALSGSKYAICCKADVGRSSGFTPSLERGSRGGRRPAPANTRKRASVSLNNAGSSRLRK